MVWEAYKGVKRNGGSAGVDKQSIAMFDEAQSKNLYKIWNRMTSGSYFPPPVIVRDMKKHTSVTLKAAIKNNNWKVGKSGCYGLWKEQVGKIAITRIFSSGSSITNHLKLQGRICSMKNCYIYQHQIQAGFVTREEDWKYSSARDFCGIKGLGELNYS